MTREGIPESLRAFIAGSLARARVPGCSIALVNDSGTLWSAGVGLADLRDSRPSGPDTVYRLFSGTELFTAVALMQLEEMGALRLDDPVERFLPQPGEARGIRLHHLLSHQSGLRNTLRGFLRVSLPSADLPSSADALSHYRLRRRRPPGQRVEYRNVNYAILGEVITRVSGLEYRDYVSRYVLEPLRMAVGFRLTDRTRRSAATGYMRSHDPMGLVLRLMFPRLPSRLYGPRVDGLRELREYDLATSAIGGLVGSMPEFGKFLQSQLAGTSTVSSERTTRLMQTQVAVGAAGIASKVGVGLGWKIGRVSGRTFLNHEGTGAGFTTELRLYPDAGLGIALGMNSMRMPATAFLAHGLCEATFAAWRESTRGRPRRVRPATTGSALRGGDGQRPRPPDHPAATNDILGAERTA